MVPGAPRPISKRQTMFDEFLLRSLQKQEKKSKSLKSDFARANAPFKKNGAAGGGAWVSVSASLKQQLEELKTEIDCASASTFKENGAEQDEKEKTASGGVAWVSVSKDAQVNTETIVAETTNKKEMWCCHCVVA